MRVATPLLLGLIACATPYRHLDGSRFTPLGPPVPLPEGWIVLDSTARGIQALVEIQSDTAPQGSGALQLGVVAFRLAPDARWSLGRAHLEGPFCLRNGSPSSAPKAGDQGNHVIDVTGQHCSYVVRAEFQLDRRPMPGDSVTVTYGGRVTRLIWP